MIRIPIARFLVTCGAALACLGTSAADLTAAETRWVRGIWPVVTFARAERLPLDLVVQPQPTPGAAPLALAFVEGRCKLVLSMRGNPQAEASLAQIDPEFLDTALELMAAHELGHCRRYLDGAWHGLPRGFAPALPAGLSSALRSAVADQDAARREEAYGDLVGLAWVQRRHPGQFAQALAWLLAERTADRIPGSPHDTLPWVELARNGVGSADESIFDAARVLWQAGLVGQGAEASESP